MTWPLGTVVSVATGRVGSLSRGTRVIRTAFVKTSATTPMRLGETGFDGDEHVYEHHGGPDMAALVYPFDHYPTWERDLGRSLVPPQFGENLTVAGFTEADVHIGDIMSIGQAVVQVTQPRTPCYKLAAAFGIRDMAVRVQETGRTGYLVRVLTEGDVAAGDRMALVDRGSHGVTVAEAGRIVNLAGAEPEAIEAVLDIETLGSAVRRTLEARLRSRPPGETDQERLFGMD